MQLFKRIAEQEASDEVLFVEGALFARADVLFLVEVGAERQEAD